MNSIFRQILSLFTGLLIVLSSQAGLLNNLDKIVEAQTVRLLPARIQVDDTPADIFIRGDFSSVVGTGDFNGDGADDFFTVYYKRVTDNGATRIVFQKYGIIFGKRNQNLPVEINLLSDEPDLSLTSVTGGFSISTVTNFGDLNGDGKDDISLTQFLPGEGGNPPSRAIKVFFGSASLQPGVVDLDTLQPGLRITPDRRAAVTGIGGVGDINGDGVKDLILTERGSDIPFTLAILLGPFPSGKAIDLNSQRPNAIITFNGVETVDGLLLGDFNGDGTADMLIRKGRFDSRIGLLLGSFNVVFGSPDLNSGAEISLSDGQADAIITAGNYFSTLATGDVNGDGFDDILIGTSVHYGEVPVPTIFFGAVSVILGSASIKGVISQADISINNLSVPSSFQSGFEDALGQSLEVSDINGDGISDILIGAPGLVVNEDKSFKFFNRVHVILGSKEITKGAPVVIGREMQDITINFGKKTGDVGKQLRSGDFNGDGFGDILVGNFSNDYVFFGGPLRPPQITKATYRRNSSELSIFGTDFTGSARIEINGAIADREVTFDSDANKLVLLGDPSGLNLHDGKNQVTVIRKDARSNTVKLKLK